MVKEPFGFPMAFTGGGSVSAPLTLTGEAAKGAALYYPSGMTAANIALAGQPFFGAAYVPLEDDSGQLVQITGVGTAQATIQTFPAEAWILRGMRSVVLESRNVSTNAYVNQANSPTCYLILLD